MSIQPAHARYAGPAIVAALAAISVFAVTLGGTYIYDDFDVFELDPRLRDPSQWGRFWTESYNRGIDNLYRPLVSMTYALQWWLHGADAQLDPSDAWKYHLLNVVLHAAVSACVAEFARRLLNLRTAYIAGLLFAVHPIHVEAIAMIVGRAELMCALGILGALILYQPPLTKLRAVAITACFLLALLSKEQGMLTPLLLALYSLSLYSEVTAQRWVEGAGRGFFKFSRFKFSRNRIAPSPPPSPRGLGEGVRGAQLLLILLLTWTLATYVVYREWILKFWWDRNLLDWTNNPLVRADADRWLMPIVLLGRYVALLVAPIRLSPDYGATIIGWKLRLDDPYFWLGAIALLAWIVWFITALFRRNRAAVFLLLALALTYGVVSNFPILIGTNFGERLMYLPSVFFVILIAHAAATISPRMLWLAAVVVVMLFGIRSFTYAREWNDRLSFYESVVRRQPGSTRFHIALTEEYLSRGRLDAAEETARIASERLPEYWEVWIARAKVAMEKGDFESAEKFLDIAMNTKRSPSSRVVGFMSILQQRKAATQPTTAPATR